MARPPVSALDMLRQLVDDRALLEEEISDSVYGCRAEGRSWSEIGSVLGMSAQGAHKRYHRGD